MGIKFVLVMILIAVLIGMLGLSLNVQKAEADETIYIMPDGSVSPSTAPIQAEGARADAVCVRGFDARAEIWRHVCFATTTLAEQFSPHPRRLLF